MKRIVIIFFSFFIFGCANQNPTQKQVAKYEILFNKPNIDYGGCVAALHKAPFLYIISIQKDIDFGRISIYDPKTSLLLDVPFQASHKEGCQNIHPESRKISTHAQLHFVEQADFRAIFNRHREDPSTLKTAINAGPPYFRTDGKWHSYRTTLSLNQGAVHHIKSIDDAEKYLSSISTARAQMWIDNRLSSINEIAAKEKAHQERTQRAMDVWTNRSSAAYKIGDKVCTFSSNLFGYVEEILPTRFKIHIVGQVKPAPFDVKGFFFSAGSQDFTYSKIEATRWMEKVDVAPCDFGEKDAAY